MRSSNHFAGALFCGCAVAVIATHKAGAQEALRTALESEAAALLRNMPPLPPPGDVIRWGPATFDVSVSYALDATDNSTFEETDRQKDLIQRPMVNLGVLLQISPRSRLDFRTGVGYEDYIDNTSEDRLFITPGSELAFDVRAGKGVVTVFDRFEYTQDVAEQGAIAGEGSVPRFENRVGLRSIWQFDNWVYQAGFAHLNVLVLGASSDEGSDFRHLERADEQFFGRVGYLFDEVPLHAGIEATAALADYVVDTQRDPDAVSLGPFMTWTAADALKITMRGGVVYVYFNKTDGLDATDYTTYYAGLNLDHRLTSRFTYGFALTHDIRAGFNEGTDYIETSRAEFDGTWLMTRFWRWSWLLFAEDAKEVALSNLGQTEKYRRFGISAGPTYQVSDHLSTFAHYAFTLRDSDIEGRSYRENRATIGVTFRF